MTNETGSYLKTSDVTLYYVVYGDSTGVPLIALNGGPGRSHQALLNAPVWNELAQERPVVFYDQRGTGRSSRLEAGGSCTLGDQLLDLEVLRTHLYGGSHSEQSIEAEQVDLLGHSWGGYLAMAYTARYPQQVRRLILVGSAAPRIQDTVMLAKELFPEIVERREQLKVAWRLGDEEAFQEAERLYRSLCFYSSKKRDEFLATSGRSVMHFDVARALNADLQRFDLNPVLPKFTQPTLVVTGRFDLIVAPSVAYAIHKAIPNSQFVVFEQSGHRPFFEEPEAFAQTVRQFLTEDNDPNHDLTTESARVKH
ncbi:MAG: alpha/beta fold hydrolase [Caldilineaceae bacterium]